MTKLRHYDDWGTARFVTFSCYRRLPVLRDDRAKEILVKYLHVVREKHQFKLFGYVIMPEHVHLVIYPPEGMKLGLVIREIKSRSTKEYFAESEVAPAGAQRVFWQRRCYDHNCRTPEATLEKIRYCHHNPVQRSLVSDPGKWKWSSYNWYQGEKNVPLKMDSFHV
jgi:putative transposase